MLKLKPRKGLFRTNWQPHGYQGFGFFIHGLWSGSPPDTRGRSPVRKSRTPGSVRGVSGNGYPYRDNVANGIPPTIINAEMLNTFQRELVKESANKFLI